LPTAHALARRRQIPLHELQQHDVLLLEEGHCLREQALDICGTNRSDTGEEFKATSLETLRQMVAAGAGCTLLPALAASPAAGLPIKAMIEIRPFAEPVPTRLIGLVWRRSFPRATVVHNLKRIALEHRPEGTVAIDARRHR
jgi:LysR family hydrogen peroxide-inducible transcriptional activator